MPLSPVDRTKLDAGDDAQFYSLPRFVTHVDEGFIDQLTNLYRERLAPRSRVLDLMSSWVSHLPEELPLAQVTGHGMNDAELARNPRLDDYFVQDLNAKPQLPLADGAFDAVLMAVSVQYLQYPEAVFQEMRRVLRPDGVAIVSFSNRMFFQKAIQIWRDSSEAARIELVQRYLLEMGGFAKTEVVARPAQLPSLLQWLGVGGGDPFYAVIGSR